MQAKFSHTPRLLYTGVGTGTTSKVLVHEVYATTMYTLKEDNKALPVLDPESECVASLMNILVGNTRQILRFTIMLMVENSPWIYATIELNINVTIVSLCTWLQ